MKQLMTERKMNADLFKSYLSVGVYVCLSVNNPSSTINVVLSPI